MGSLWGNWDLMAKQVQGANGFYCPCFWALCFIGPNCVAAATIVKSLQVATARFWVEQTGSPEFVAFVVGK